MNSIVRTMTIVAASMLFSAIPMRAEEGNVRATQSGAPNWEKGLQDECLLVTMNCGKDVDSIQERIKRLDMEISRGSIYTPEELKKLREERDNYQRQFDLMMESGGGG